MLSGVERNSLRMLQFSNDAKYRLSLKSFRPNEALSRYTLMKIPNRTGV